MESVIARKNPDLLHLMKSHKADLTFSRHVVCKIEMSDIDHSQQVLSFVFGLRVQAHCWFEWLLGSRELVTMTKLLFS